ncbi:hypothetical protein D2V08_01705 [Flagellimonas lutimaris]|uniref:Uncharacterized protein n=2 Tax=Flagellimonas lutimaris TaxID=475082 RepID=A0A3A1NAS6_9FLAO|nr:hypothetical protein D2V08_01705 [Allomuricauda lutimaris]
MINKTLKPVIFFTLLIFTSCSDDDCTEAPTEPVAEQCDIPNASFDNFSTITEGSVTYDLPDEWTESNALAFLRGSTGNGFFNKYEGSDASNGLALKLKRSHHPDGNTIESFQKGYIHYACNQIPKKLKGRYKFRGAGDFGTYPEITDTLRVVVKFSSSTNQVSMRELELSDGRSEEMSGNVKILDITSETDIFQDFELDFTEFIDQSSDLVSIHLILKQGRFADAGIPLSFNFANAVIDDLEFEY